MKKYIIIANWKNNPNTLKEALNNFKIIKTKRFDLKKMEVVICPSFLHLSELNSSYRGKSFKFGVQNFYINDNDSHTGEVTINQLQDLNIQYAIIGHAERRKLGESDTLVSEKLKEALENRIRPILCIGEDERDEKGEYLKFLEKQLISSLNNISEKEIKKIVIAYEPLWAIGTNKYVSPADIHIVNILIKKLLTTKYGRKDAFAVPILYGGSVDAENCNELISGGDIDGLLVGRASANPHSFSDILGKVEKI